MSKKNHRDEAGHRLRRKHWRNEHHLLFPKTAWGRSKFGKKLRAHQYFRKYIPEFTLHKKIHHRIITIPLPPESACETAYYELLRRCSCHSIDQYHDTLEKRLQLLIDLWSQYPKTVNALKAQQKIAIEFYKNGRL